MFRCEQWLQPQVVNTIDGNRTCLVTESLIPCRRATCFCVILLVNKPQTIFLPVCPTEWFCYQCKDTNNLNISCDCAPAAPVHDLRGRFLSRTSAWIWIVRNTAVGPARNATFREQHSVIVFVVELSGKHYCHTVFACIALGDP